MFQGTVSPQGKGNFGRLQGARARRIARSVPLVLLCAVVLGVALVAYLVDVDPRAVSAPTWQLADAPSRAGLPRPWEAGIQVSTYSTANTRNHNLITVIPIIGWTGVGPDIEMVLYHNSTNVNSDFDLTRGMGFGLGPGWTMSYSAQLIIDLGTKSPLGPVKITAIADDGTQDAYTKQGGNWVAPPGVFDVLTKEGYFWRLTHKDQSYHEFSVSSGLLTRVVDATGHAVEISRWGPGMIHYVTDAAGRSLEFGCVIDRLAVIADPKEPGEDPDDIDDRSWFLEYNADGRVNKITDPEGNEIAIGYDTGGRIETLTDNRGADEPEHTYVYTYRSGSAIATVTDPQGDGGEPRVQTFVAFPGGRKYTDRRGQDWLYEYEQDGTLSGFTNPLGHRWTFDFDTDKNLTLYCDPLGNGGRTPCDGWTYTYDDRGNMLTATDPLSHMREWAYNSLNSLTSYTDALDNVWDLSYDEPNFPTLLTQINEPPAESGGDPATTLLTYYYDEDPQPDGMLKTVRDPNGVLTGFEYDEWGQLSRYGEGDPPVERGDWPLTPMVLETSYVSDSGSRVQSAMIGSGRAMGGGMNYDLLNRPTDSWCPPMSKDPEPPPLLREGFPNLPCELLNLPDVYGWMTSASYTGTGLLDAAEYEFELQITGNPEEWTRTYNKEYDELGMIASSEIESDESGSTIVRGFTYDMDWGSGQYTRTGPDGVETFVQLDAANRVETVRRGPAGDPIMTAAYTYYADGLVHSVSYGNGTSVWYEYDEARRLTWVRHKDPLDCVLLLLNYEYNHRDEIVHLTELDGETPYDVTFTYDNRGRLTHERRTLGVGGPAIYDLTYEYDPGGNRTAKIDSVNEREVVYHYDIDDALTYGSDNNRLMYYETLGTNPLSSPLGKGGLEGGGTRPDDRLESRSHNEVGRALPNDRLGSRSHRALLSTTYYYYSDAGNVTRIVTNEAGSDHYSATRFGYAQNGQAVTYILGEEWDWDGDPGNCPTEYNIEYAREFRYDEARARYLNRELDPAELMQGDFEALSETWSDYDGDDIYGDFEVVGGDVTNLRSFEPGMGKVDPWTGTGSASTSYYHANLIGTTRLMSDSGGTGVSPVTYTAFGERIEGTNHRYGYAGAWGYQAHDFPESPDDPIPYLHVGARYYDPATGRFLQRDPIGIRGGLNVYAYVRNGPTIRIDPDGLAQFDVEACVGYCQSRKARCLAGARDVKKVLKCLTKYQACQTCCGNADIDSEMGNDRGPPPYGPPPATFDPWPAGGWRWRAIAILLLCFVSLWAKRMQPVPRVSQ